MFRISFSSAIAVALIVCASGVSALAQIVTPAATPVPAVPAVPITIAVELGDFVVTPSSSTLRAGQPYLFLITNAGKEVHELVLEPADAINEPLTSAAGDAAVKAIKPGETKALTWTFAMPGKYQLACHVPGHYEAGMKAQLEVMP